jgi:hypothetical protein
MRYTNTLALLVLGLPLAAAPPAVIEEPTEELQVSGMTKNEVRRAMSVFATAHGACTDRAGHASALPEQKAGLYRDCMTSWRGSDRDAALMQVLTRISLDGLE